MACRAGARLRPSGYDAAAFATNGLAERAPVFAPSGYDAAAFATNGLAEPKQAQPAKAGGARRDRTADLLHAMQALSQLSYGPTQGRRNLRTASGLVKLGLSSVSVRRTLAEQHRRPARPARS